MFTHTDAPHAKTYLRAPPRGGWGLRFRIQGLRVTHTDAPHADASIRAAGEKSRLPNDPPE